MISLKRNGKGELVKAGVIFLPIASSFSLIVLLLLDCFLFFIFFLRFFGNESNRWFSFVYRMILGYRNNT